MDFYKILRQQDNIKAPFYKLLEANSYILGNEPSSFAIRYNPEAYNNFLRDEVIFQNYLKSSIKQLFVTNQKFITILKNEDFFDLELVNCIFDEGTIDSFLYEDEELSVEVIEELLRRNDYRISEAVCVTREGKQIRLQKNGVIGFDENLNKDEHSNLMNLMDTLNCGLKVLRV
ncbi:hypothetical protein EFO40_05845 [Lactococcus cremoris]|uniref:hypothetical protein n=1 Tax=Lactococcus lactis subsp. cremoris TaxID=1359 RepID=UPI0021AAAB52|nr:hypothetical protein [Lactococcus cremoris]MCT4462997.1 hypothetical protein [Lactococcus cremoris]